MDKELLKLPHEFLKDKNGIPTLDLAIVIDADRRLIIPASQLNHLHPIPTISIDDAAGR